MTYYILKYIFYKNYINLQIYYDLLSKLEATSYESFLA